MHLLYSRLNAFTLFKGKGEMIAIFRFKERNQLYETMKKFKLLVRNVALLGFLLSAILLAQSCGNEDNDTPNPGEGAKISVNSSAIKSLPGEDVSITATIVGEPSNTINVAYKTGTDSVFVKAITSSGSDDVEISYSFDASDDVTLTIIATDIVNNSASSTEVVIEYVKPETVILDFSEFVRYDHTTAGSGGIVVGSARRKGKAPSLELRGWPGSQYGEAGSADTVNFAAELHLSTAASETGNSNGNVPFPSYDYEAELPSLSGIKGLKFSNASLKQNGAEEGSFVTRGATVEQTIRLGEGKTIPTDDMLGVRTGQRVFALDVYFDDSDPMNSFSTISSSRHKDANYLVEASGKEKTDDGVKFVLRTISLDQWIDDQTERIDEYANAPESFPNLIPGQEIGAVHGLYGYSECKEAYLTEAGKWVTLYFTDNDKGDQRLAPYIRENSDVSPGEENLVFIYPNYSYGKDTDGDDITENHYDENNIYYRNLRIVTPEFDPMSMNEQ